MEDKDYRLIDQFLRKELDESDIEKVNTKRRSDADFESELAFQTEVKDFLQHRTKRAELKKQLLDLKQDNKEEDTKVISLNKRILFTVGIAASILLILFFSYPLLFPSSIYDQFAQHQQVSFQVRDNNNADVQSAETAFNKGDYRNAYLYIKKMIAQDSIPNSYHQLALGIAALEIGQSDEAESLFTKIAAGESVFAQEAEWYLALSYIKKGEQKKALPILKSIQEEPWKSKASLVLTKLSVEYLDELK